MNAASIRSSRNSSPWLRLLLSVVCLAGFAGGCYLGVITYRAIVEAERSLTWPTVPGRIVRSGVDVSVSRQRSNDRDRRYEETRSYSAAIEYEFDVSGKTLTGTRIAVMSDQFGSRDWAEATSTRFPVGSDVTVSYNPEKPEECVLQPGRWGGAGFVLIAAGLLILFPPVILKAIWSNERPPAGHDPKARAQRVLNGIEFRERILAWEPGETIHLQRDSMGFLSLVAGAIISGLILGGLVGLAPALLFFSGRGPIFIGQFYLAASLLVAIVCGVWLWIDNRPRQTHIEWHSQQIRLVTGSRQTDVVFSDVQQLVLFLPEQQKETAAGSGQPPRTHKAQIRMIAAGKSFIVLETEFTMPAFRAVRKALIRTARQLAAAMNVHFDEAEDP